MEKVAFGQPFTVTVQLQNRSTEMRTVTAILSASSIHYTGVSGRRLGRTDRQLVLQPGQRETFQVRVTFSFLNPLSVSLTDCEFTFEGPGLVRPQTVKYRDVKMGEMVSHVQKFIPRSSGDRKIVVTFNSRELVDVIGSKPVPVRD